MRASGRRISPARSRGWRLRRPSHPHDEHVGNRRVGDPHRAAGEPVAALHVLGAGDHAARVEAMIRLGEAEAAENDFKGARRRVPSPQPSPRGRGSHTTASAAQAMPGAYFIGNSTTKTAPRPGPSLLGRELAAHVHAGERTAVQAEAVAALSRGEAMGKDHCEVLLRDSCTRRCLSRRM